MSAQYANIIIQLLGDVDVAHKKIFKKEKI